MTTDVAEVEEDAPASSAADPERPEAFQKIWHGDSRQKLLKVPAGTVDCIITDPPFGVDNKSNMATTAEGKKYARKIANDESPEQAISVFMEVMNVLCPRTADDADMYVFTAHQVLEEWLGVARWLEKEHGFKKNALLIWDKQGPGMGDLAGWGMGYEHIIFLKKGRKPRYAKRRTGIISVPQVRPGDLIHPHEKPAQLLQILMKHSMRERDFAVDPFGGSGSLPRAAQGINRSALAVEYDLTNYELAKKALNAGAGGMF